MQELLDRGLKIVPVTIWNDQVVIGFNPKELARVFHLDASVAQADVPTMINKFATVLVAACRATSKSLSNFLTASISDSCNTYI